MLNNFVHSIEQNGDMVPYIRSESQTLKSRVEEPRRFIQVVAGPRQVGKTTLIKQTLEKIDVSSHYAFADIPTVLDIPWLEQQWEVARLKAKEQKAAFLVLDEIQKIPFWAEKVKKLWDEDTFNETNLKVIILGSSPLLIQKGLTETLAGRFEIIHMTHWSYSEMHAAFGWNFEQYLYFGGYPGSAALIQDQMRWLEYINQSLIETTISRDIQLMTRIDKPILLRRLFELGCHYSSQILSYQKMLGQLADAGNATTLAHYLKLLSGAGMIDGLQKYSGKIVTQKASSPKLQVYNTALISAQRQSTFESANRDKTYWGRLVESSVGAHILNEGQKYNIKVFYWRERNKEVDFVLQKGESIIAIEVKTGLMKEYTSGMLEFKKKYPHTQRMLMLGKEGIPIESFLNTPLIDWFK